MEKGPKKTEGIITEPSSIGDFTANELILIGEMLKVVKSYPCGDFGTSSKEELIEEALKGQSEENIQLFLRHQQALKAELAQKKQKKSGLKKK